MRVLIRLVREDCDVVSGFSQLPHHKRTEETGTADNEAGVRRTIASLRSHPRAVF